jgi:triphosphoribosyl-dephospho-CoA synthase
MRSAAANAELALLLEVAGTPKPGNVDRERDLADLRFEQFLAGAVGARPGLQAASDGAAVGAAFETAVRGMSEQSGGNTQFGCLLLLVPLVRAAAEKRGPDADRDGDLEPTDATAVAEATTVADAAAFYRAFEHVDVFVDDPPEGFADLDVRRGRDAVPALEERGLTLYDVMELSRESDGLGREWTGGFRRSFETADRILADDGPVVDRAARAFLALLAAEPDTMVAKQHGEAVAEEVRERAADRHANGWDREAVAAFGDDLVERGVNPGTTADVVAAGLFVALERGLEL